MTCATLAVSVTHGGNVMDVFDLLGLDECKHRDPWNSEAFTELSLWSVPAMENDDIAHGHALRLAHVLVAYQDWHSLHAIVATEPQPSNILTALQESILWYTIELSSHRKHIEQRDNDTDARMLSEMRAWGAR